MHRTITPLATIAIVALAVACSDVGTPVQPSPSATGPSLSTGAAAAPTTFALNINDRCDPLSFNAALGAGTCTRQGPVVTFQNFLAQIRATGRAEAWRFSPSMVTLNPGQVL